MKFLIVEPSPLPILITLGPKYSPQDPVFKQDSKLYEENNKECIYMIHRFESLAPEIS